MSKSLLNRRLLVLLAGGSVLLAQQEQPARIPSFLQGLSPAQLNSKPIQRFLHNWNMRSNDGETIPDPPGERILQANSIIGNAPAPGLSYVLNTRWTALGPQPIVNGQIGNVQTNRPMSGRVSSIAVHPTDLNRWLVGTANGGVWETRNGGTTFVALTDAAPTLAVGAVSYAPSNPSIIYVGTGEATFSGVSYGGEGILKSIDGGLNWTQIAKPTFFKGTAFADLKVDPSNPNILVAATAYGVFGRPRVTTTAVGARGLWRSTDGGVTWSNPVSGPAGTSLSTNPSNFQQQYAGLWNTVANNMSDTIKRSTDGGQTWSNVSGPWTAIAANTDRAEVAIAPSNPNRVYVTIQSQASGGLHGLWTTANAWDPTPTWTAIPLGPTDDGTGTLGPCGFDKAFNSASPQCFYNMELTVKPTDENTLFYGGIPLWRYNLGTNTWVEVSQTASPANRNDGIHVDQHASAWAGSRLIFGNDGGVWSTTTDGTGPWASHNATLATVQYYEGSSSPDGSIQLGGSQDNGTHVRSGAIGWPLTFGGDGAGNLASSNLNWAVSSQNQNIARTTNAGANYTGVRGNYGGVAPFIGKVRECAATPGTVILNGSRVNRTTNFYGGPSATLWSNGGFIFTPATAGSAIAFGNVCTTMGAAHSNGEIRISTTGGLLPADFVERDPANQVPNRPVSVIVFPTGSNTTVFVGLGGFSNGTPANIYKTTDFTVASPTWTSVSVPVDGPVNSLAIDPGNNNIMYAGTDYGVWFTNNGGTNWSHMGPRIGMPNVPVFDLVIRPGRVFAFTHGRGAFTLSNFDVNADTTVSCADVTVVRNAMGKRIGEGGFNAAADLNSDNRIDVRDLAMLTKQLPAGTTCP